MRKRENARSIAAAIGDLMAAVNRLEEKVEACNGLCEAVLDEVVPIGLAMDALAADAPASAD